MNNAYEYLNNAHLREVIARKDEQMALLRQDKARLLEALAAVQEKNEELGMGLMTLRHLLREVRQ